MSTKNLLILPHGQLPLPVFMPDATYGFVHALDKNDLQLVGIKALVMNIFHLMRNPGTSVIKSMGGLHNFSSWHGPIVTDSGGFQVYSMIRKNPKLGTISKKGVYFHSQRDFLLTPEKSIQLQLNYDADIIICLDYCTHPDDPYELQVESVNRTIDWAKRCRLTFDNHLKQSSSQKNRPLLFAVIQGGKAPELRRQCAESLLEIGFDGYGFGGYPLDANGELVVDTIRTNRELIPKEFPMFALGIGSPQNVAKVFELGYNLFDSSLPTRDARQGRLYTTLNESDEQQNHRYSSYIYIEDKKHIKSSSPILVSCDCLTCKNYTRAFLHLLFKRKDPLYHRLATIHNLRYITKLLEQLRGNY